MEVTREVFNLYSFTGMITHMFYEGNRPAQLLWLRRLVQLAVWNGKAKNGLRVKKTFSSFRKKTEKKRVTGDSFSWLQNLI
jgi:hypothetical protein